MRYNWPKITHYLDSQCTMCLKLETLVDLTFVARVIYSFRIKNDKWSDLTLKVNIDSGLYQGVLCAGGIRLTSLNMEKEVSTQAPKSTQESILKEEVSTECFLTYCFKAALFCAVVRLYNTIHFYSLLHSISHF